MAEPIDLLDTLHDSREIVLELMNDLSGNPVDPGKIPLVSMCIGAYNNINHAIEVTQRLVSGWEGR